MSAYKDLDIMVQEVSLTPEVYESNKEMVSDYLSGELKLLPQCLEDVIHAWEQEKYENYGTETVINEKMSLVS